MSPRHIGSATTREVPVAREDEPMGSVLPRLLDSGLPALPVVDRDGRFAGIFGEREFMQALFPGYVGELKGAAFVRGELDEALQRRAGCSAEPVGRHMTTDHVEIRPDASDVQIAETFLHHRVLLLPVVEDGRISGAITRSDFFRALAERLLAGGEASRSEL